MNTSKLARLGSSNQGLKFQLELELDQDRYTDYPARLRHDEAMATCQ